jgi:hypothetical protein
MRYLWLNPVCYIANVGSWIRIDLESMRSKTWSQAVSLYCFLHNKEKIQRNPLQSPKFKLNHCYLLSPRIVNRVQNIICIWSHVVPAPVAMLIHNSAYAAHFSHNTVNTGTYNKCRNWWLSSVIQATGRQEHGMVWGHLGLKTATLSEFRSAPWAFRDLVRCGRAAFRRPRSCFDSWCGRCDKSPTQPDHVLNIVHSYETK